jgi:hypothetical protein
MSFCWPVFQPGCGHFSQQILNDERVCEICTRPPVMRCGHVPDKRSAHGQWRCSSCIDEGGDLIDTAKAWNDLAGRKMICFICSDERNAFLGRGTPSEMEAMDSSWSAYGFRYTPTDEYDYWYCGWE